ncbi:MAG TPA: benzoate-CoA ligase family protein [Candidatus Binatia bacterium]|jgi:benzoate-CoA ligase|nr:benzoate-CoA ligase family protein [Candidatus Binatia bacterium]
MKLDLPDIYNAATTFVDENIAQGRDEHVAIYYQDQKFTYRDVYEKVNQTGNALRNLGLEIEQRVLLVLPDSPEFAFSFFGAIKIGAVPIPTNPWMKAKDYKYLLQDSRARILLVHESSLSEVEPIWDQSRYLKHVIVVGKPRGKSVAYDFLISKAATTLEPERTSKDDVVMWNYTSGSTGSPKGAVHLQHDMITITDLFVKPVLGMREDDICFSASKLFFSYGLGNSLYFPFRFGAATVLWPERPDPEKILQVIEKYRPTFFFSVPTLYARLLRVEKDYDLSSLRICLSSGEPLPPALFQQWKQKYGIELLDVVGSTEATHDFLANRPGRAKAGSSGEVTPAFEAKIVDEEGRELPIGQIGNLLVKGDANAPYYWNKHDQTKRTMLGEWLKTGDTYYRDEEGYYWYCGRSDDMLKVGGLWVSPIEIENTLLEHPSVLEAAVAGQPDHDGLTKPKAYVLLKSEYRPSDQLKDELQSLVKSKLAPYKYPRWIDFVEELPKTVTGKIQRFRLRGNKN